MNPGDNKLQFLYGLLLAIYLPPVFALFIFVRWLNVPRWARAASVVFSLLTPAFLVYPWIGANESFWLTDAAAWSFLLMWTFFTVSYLHRRNLRAPLLLKVGTVVIYGLFVLSTLTVLFFHLLK